MITQRKTALLSALVLSVSLAACAGEASDAPEVAAASDEPEIIDERQANFKAISDHFKAIRTELEGESPDLTAIETAATDLNAAALKVEGHFPAGTGMADGYDSEALATIWEKPEDFAAAQTMLIDASAQMITLAQGGDVVAVGDQVGAIGKSCKNCHDTFRKPKD